MEQETQYLLHLLGAYLRQEAPRPQPDVDWVRLTKLAQKHNVMGILGYLSMTYPICPDESLNATLRSICLNTIAEYANRAALAEMRSQELSRNGIDHILMKGYVLRNYFPVPELRTFGDIDIVIRHDDREKSDALMMQSGFQRKSDWEPVFGYRKDNEFYELHTEIMEVDVSDRADYRGYFRELWHNTVSLGDHCYEFTPEYHFLYMLTHIAKHVTGSGAGIRMYLDVGAFICRYGKTLNWDAVRREMKKLALEEFCNTVLSLVQTCFGLDSPIPLSPMEQETMDSFVAFTMSGGIFGRADRDSGAVSLQKQSRNGTEVSRFGTVMERMFPSAESIQSRYTYLQEKPWLLPVAWVHRFVKTRAAWHAHTEEIQGILHADKEAVQRITRLYRQIGL